MLENLSKMILWCVRYYQHRMNSFWKLFNVLFGETQDYFFVIEFQSERLAHDHGLLWVQCVLQFGISSSETIENFIDKYITTDQTFFQIEIHSAQIHQHKRTCQNKNQPICQFQYLKLPMKSTTNILPLDEHDCVPKFHEITNNIFLKTCWYGIRCRYFFWTISYRFKCKWKKLHFCIMIHFSKTNIIFET